VLFVYIKMYIIENKLAI